MSTMPQGAQTRLLCRWNGQVAGEAGTMDFFPGTEHEFSLEFPNFKAAHAVQQLIESRIAAERRRGREELLEHIGRIKA